MEDKKKKIILSVIGVLALLALVAGVTYAAFNFIGGSTGNNTVRTGQISMSYSEPSNAMILNNALPVSDTEGKATANYFEFTVSSHATTNASDNTGVVIPYEINITSKSITGGMLQLPEDKIKVYLVKVENSVEVPVMEPTLISNLSASTLQAASTKVFDTEEVYKNAQAARSTTYRLRAWIDSSFDAGLTAENTYQYKFTVNVNSQDAAVGEPPVAVVYTPDYCFDYTTDTTSAKITNYKCFEGNTFGLETITDVVIPVTLGGKPVTEIAGTTETEISMEILKSFTLKGLTSVVIPNSVETIGNWAFAGNSYISTPILPDTLITIGDFAFVEGASMTGTLIIPNNVVTIGVGAFSGCRVTNLTIGTSVTTIGEGAFGAAKIGILIIPDNVIEIGREAFSANLLTSVTIGTGVTTIGEGAFKKTEHQNPNLTTIINPTGKSFDWGSIINVSSGYNFVAGTVVNTYGNVEVIAE